MNKAAGKANRRGTIFALLPARAFEKETEGRSGMSPPPSDPDLPALRRGFVDYLRKH